jgi:predicted anti-sigma-YlaC factor YlaD
MRVMRTKCDEVRQALTAFAGQEPGVRRQESGAAPDGAVADHLAGCEECRGVLADLRLLQADPNPEIPPYLTTRVMARVREVDGVPRRRFALQRLGLTAAVVLMVAVGSWVGVGLGRGIMSESIGRRAVLQVLTQRAGAGQEAAGR